MTRKIILALATILPVHLQLHARNKLTLRRSAPVAELIPAKLAVQALPPVYGKTTPVSCPVRLFHRVNTGTAQPALAPPQLVNVLLDSLGTLHLQVGQDIAKVLLLIQAILPLLALKGAAHGILQLITVKCQVR